MERSTKIYLVLGSLLGLIAVGAVAWWLTTDDRGGAVSRSNDKSTQNGAEYGEKQIDLKPSGTVVQGKRPPETDPVEQGKTTDRDSTHRSGVVKGERANDRPTVPVAEDDPNDPNDPKSPGIEDLDDKLILGPKSWMAEVPEAEQQRIDDAFARAEVVDPKLTPVDRRTSIEAARQVVTECFADHQKNHPNARGRIIVSWNADAIRGAGQLSAPVIDVNLGLRDPIFESCILGGLNGLTFSAERDGEMRRVKYPFFFDEK